jgi:hypothetical protein
MTIIKQWLWDVLFLVFLLMLSPFILVGLIVSFIFPSEPFDDYP